MRLSLFLFLAITLNSFSQEKKISLESIILGGKLENLNGVNKTSYKEFQYSDVMLINVTIDSKALLFLYDTGSPISLVSDKIAKNDNVLMQIPLKDGLGKEKKGDVIIKNLLINEVSFNNIAFATMDFKELNKKSCIKIDGILGANAIKLCNWKINPLEQTISFSNTPFNNKDSKIFNVEYYQGLVPIVNVSINNKNVWVSVDTGFDKCFKLNDSFFLNNNKVVEGQGNYFNTINDESEQKIKKTITDTIKIGNISFSNLKTLVLNDKSSIGMGFLKKYIILLNNTEKKICLSEITSSSSQKFDLEYSLKVSVNKKNQLFVSFLWENEETKNQKIKIGDIILSVNGINCENISEETFCKIKTEFINKDALNIVFYKRQDEVILVSRN